jgi:hypothetical protein
VPRARPSAAASVCRSLRQTLLLFDVTRFVQKHETAVKAAEAAVIEESMLSKDALSQAQAEFEKYSNVVKKFFF